MVAFVRRFLILSLALLQFVAPLVHAHVDNSGRSSGLHLHEFESLHFQTEAIMTAVDRYTTNADSAIVDVGTAIDAQQSDTDDISFFIQSSIALTVPCLIDKINFSPHLRMTARTVHHKQHLTRAPPI